MHLLNSLLQFYDQERSWVYHTRASLELARVQLPLSVTPTQTPTPPLSEKGTGDTELAVKREEDADADADADVDVDDSIDTPRGRNSGSVPIKDSFSRSRWLKRKQSFNLKLDGLSLAQQVARKRAAAREAPKPGVQLLELFADLVDSRMESCHRVSRLVRDSNRSMLHTW